ncbi:Cytochrome c [Chitinophaga jiangningensis]|uniref:Cytochrome c n=1 Tax=Chitinophaga jiangningensis TaxID=1419482 RepID=A0A1M7JT70_9BACT|nr:cytochrome c [Chitinophaga jiangningensis]SHM56216.1 Cytochrome c [Chitinophaga jiangningensis]
MLRRLSAVLLIVVIAFACNNAQDNISVLHTDALIPDVFTINTTVDTVLTTSYGARIHIPANAIQSKALTLKLEVREAYTIGDIIKAGLLTRANGEILSSGGMINILPVTPDDARIVKPIRIEIPTDFVREGMQLYRGEVDKNGNMNWVEPVSIPQQEKTFARWVAAEKMLEDNCSSCHSLDRNITGPSLRHVTACRTREWLAAFTYNSAALLAKEDPEAICIFNAYGRQAMPAFAGFTEAEVTDIYDYIDNYSKQADLTTFNQQLLAKDSCNAYTKALARLQRLEIQQRQLVETNNAGMVITHTAAPQIPASVGIITDTLSKVIPPSFTGQYYSFEIKTFDWYNIDILLKDVKGVVQGSLRVTLTGTYKNNTHVFLIIPDLRIFAEGGWLRGESDVMGFYGTDGKLPVLPDKKAWIIGTGEEKGQIRFAKSILVTKQDNNVVLTPAPAGPQAMNDFLNTLNFKGIQIDVSESKHADSLRGVEEEIQKIKAIRPTSIPCDCGYNIPQPAPQP